MRAIFLTEVKFGFLFNPPKGAEIRKIRRHHSPIMMNWRLAYQVVIPITEWKEKFKVHHGWTILPNIKN